MRRSMRACLAVCAATAALGSFAAAAQALPANFWGVVFQAEPSEIQFQQLRRGGVDSMRVQIEWASVQPQRNGPYDWKGTDQVVRRAGAAGIEILPYLTGAPSWAVPQTRVPGTSLRAPARLPVSGAAAGAWKRFLRAAVRRYGRGGSFWAENPSLPQRPVRYWQIWNEPNFKYFVARPNPGQYGKLVKLSYGAIHGVDRGARIILAGLFARPNEARWKVRPPQAYFAATFIEQMYKRTPGVRSMFQGIALHPYTGTYKNLTPYVEELRRVLKRNHDAGKGLWITELGWSSSKPVGRENTFNKGPQGQVVQLKGAFRLLERNQARWHVQRVYWFSVDDQLGSCNFCDGSGLFAEGWIPKRSWYAYVKFAGGRP